MKLHLLALAALLSTGAHAVERVWDGGAGSAGWRAIGHFNTTNWSLQVQTGAAPVLFNGVSLAFDGNTQTTSVNDYTDLSVSGLKFRSGAGAFALSGNTLISTGDVVNQSRNAQQISFASLVVGADQTWDGGKFGMTVNGFTLDENKLTLAGSIRLDNSGSTTPTTIGRTGPASLLAGVGATLASGTTYLAGTAGLSSQVQLQDGARWDASGLFYVGTQGDGRLNLLRGASLLSVGGHVGRFAGSTGRVDILDGDSRWLSSDASSVVQVGYEGVGQVNVHGGQLLTPALYLGKNGGSGAVTVTGASAVLAGGQGASDAVRDLRVGSSLGYGSLSLDAGATLRAGTLTIDAPDAGSDHLGSWLRQGAGTQAFIDNLRVGPDGSWTLTDSASAQLGQLQVGAVASSNVRGMARVALSGAAQLNTSSVTIGNQTPASLSVGAGTILNDSGTLRLGSQGQLLIDGGTVVAGSLNVAAGGQLDWRSGNLTVVGSSGLQLGAGATAGAVLVVPAAATLGVAHSLTLGTGGVLVSSAGAQVQAGTLALAGGTWVGDLSLDRVPKISGNGQVQGRLIAGTTPINITATGSLSLGTLLSPDATPFSSGSLQVMSSSSLLLLSANATPLPSTVTLYDKSSLTAINGLRLGAGNILRTSVGASTQVHGDFVNDGSVQAQIAATISFMDAVSGHGSFSGHIVFVQGYAAGTGLVAFGGVVDFGAGSTLSLDIDAQGAGKLTGINILSMAGRLALNFDASFAATAVGGTRLDLLDFGRFDGSFSADQVSVSGFDRSRLDFSRFVLDGSVGVSAVPEPGSGWLMALGVAGLLVWRRGLPSTQGRPLGWMADRGPVPS